MIIKVRSIEAFLVFLKGIGRISPHCHFMFKENGVVVRSVTEGKTVRFNMFTNAVMADGKEFDVSFMNVGNLVKSLSVVASSENTDSIDITYDEPFLFYERVARFKLRTVKYETIEKYVSPEFGKISEMACSFDTTSEDIGKVIQQMTLFAGQDMNVYLKERGGQVVCDLDNHSKKVSDSIGIPLGTMWRGTPDSLIGIKMDSFKLINLFPNGNIIVMITKKGVLISDTECQIEPKKNESLMPESYKIKMGLICSTLKP